MFRVRTVFTGVPGTPWISNHYFDGANDAEAASMAASVATFWTALRAVIVVGVQWQVEPEVVELDPVTGAPIGSVITPGATNFGTATGDPLPWSNQAYINWGTGVFIGGRRIRGRTFVPGMSESANSTGSGPSTAVQTTINTAAAALIGTPDVGFGVWSKTNGVFVRATNGVTSPRWGVLRSRRD
jgi:hypothetical protein